MKFSLILQEEQENISRRTRSKLCLQTTAIETIESTFVPPDITTDMYDFDQDHEIDNEWREFLSEFMMPLTNTEDFLDDEKSDPEYVVMEAVPIDKEELRPVRVSKKELNQLISELLEDSCSSLTFDPEPSTSKRSGSDNQSNRSKRPKHSSPTRNKTQSPKTAKIFTADGMLNTPPLHQEPKSVETTPKPRQDELFLAPYFQTPQRMGFTTPTAGLSPAPYLPVTTVTPPSTTMVIQESPKLPQIMNVYGSEQSSISTLPPILVLNAQNQLELCSTSTLISQAFNSGNGIVQLPQFQSVVIQVPTIDLLQNRLNLSSVITAVPGDQTFLPDVTMQSPHIHVISDVQVTLPNSQILADSQNLPQDSQDPSQDTKDPSLDPPNRPSGKTNLTDDKKRKLYLQKLKAFEYLETEPPPAEKIFDENLRGFTAEQKDIYEQQMRMHAQFLSQNYLQVYPSPKWWDKAEGIKKDLEELKRVVKPETSPHTARHIDECLMMCQSWAKELDENNERNRKFAEYMHNEAEFDQRYMTKKSKFLARFHNRLMEHALSSKAIMYPQLLPHQPYRAVTFRQIDTNNGELFLIAIALQRYQQEAYQKLNQLFPSKPREPKMSRVIASLVRELKSFRKVSEMDHFVNKYKSDPRMNPIKYYFMHKKAPAVKHVIEDVDLENPKPPKVLRRGVLPKVWSTYMFSHDRVSLKLISIQQFLN